MKSTHKEDICLRIMDSTVLPKNININRENFIVLSFRCSDVFTPLVQT